MLRKGWCYLKELELAGCLPSQLFPEAASVIQKTLHHMFLYHPQPPAKKKTIKPAYQSVKIQVVLPQNMYFSERTTRSKLFLQDTTVELSL